MVSVVLAVTSDTGCFTMNGVCSLPVTSDVTMNSVCSLAATCDIGYSTMNGVCSLALTSDVGYFSMVSAFQVLPLMLGTLQ